MSKALSAFEQAALQEANDRLKQERDELAAQVEVMREALNGSIEWDKQRKFIIPYKVRDPIHAAIKIEPSASLLSHDNEVAAKALDEQELQRKLLRQRIAELERKLAEQQERTYAAKRKGE